MFVDTLKYAFRRKTGNPAVLHSKRIDKVRIRAESSKGLGDFISTCDVWDETPDVCSPNLRA